MRRETYVGQWLPEPLLTDDAPADAAAHAETADSLSMAFLVLLESLTPVERAVFLLREVFDYDYDEIARIVDKTEANCRQIFARARRHVDEGRPRFEASREERDELAARFLAAAERRRHRGARGAARRRRRRLRRRRREGPVMAAAALRRERVAKLIAGTVKQAKELGVTARLAHVNGQPGVMFLDDEERVAAVMSVDVADGLVQAIRGVTNPDKLAHLGPVLDAREILRRSRDS